MRKLKDPCPNCSRPLEPNWRMCPYCEAEIGVTAASPRRSRRRRETADTVAGGYTERGTATGPIERAPIERAPIERAPIERPGSATP